MDSTLAGFDLAASALSQATFDYLASLEWLTEHRNLALVGPPGTGKSHVADNSVGRVIDSILRADLVLVDELGFSALDAIAANHLFRVVAAAYETRSLIVTSNWAFEQWTNFLPDATTATAILDRLLHHCQVAVLSGDSYRLREAKGVRLTTK